MIALDSHIIHRWPDRVGDKLAAPALPVQLLKGTAAFGHTSAWAAIFSAAVWSSTRTIEAGDLVANALSDWVSTQTVLSSTAINRSCNVRAGASFTCKGLFNPYCATQRVAAGRSVGFTARSSARRLHSALVVRCESYLQIDATESNLFGRPTALIEASRA